MPLISSGHATDIFWAAGRAHYGNRVAGNDFQLFQVAWLFQKLMLGRLLPHVRALRPS